MLVAILAALVLQVAITQATIGDLAGEQPRFAACLKKGIALVVPMIGFTLVVGLGEMVAMLLLVVPGFILGVVWAVAVPAYLQERIGIIESLRRSRALTKGARWKIFALFLVWWILPFVELVPTGMLKDAVQVPPYLGVLVRTVVDTMVDLMICTLSTTIYVELRDVKEGLRPADLESIFA